GLSLLAFFQEHTVVPAGLQAAQRDTIHVIHSWSRRSGRRGCAACGTHGLLPNVPAGTDGAGAPGWRTSRAEAVAPDGAGFVRGRAEVRNAPGRVSLRRDRTRSVVVLVLVLLGEDRGGVVRPQLPAAAGAPEHIGGDDELTDQRPQLLTGL